VLEFIENWREAVYRERVERHLDVQGGWLRGMCAATFGFVFRVADR